MFSLFGKGKEAQPQFSNRNGLPSAVAFVDYEHWYISLHRNFNLKPNIKGWFEDLGQNYNLIEAVFFADFSHKSLSDEIKRIRPYSNKIIDTRSTSTVKKDFTDFIILDNIYQRALRSDDIDAFILFSGDGHFSSVVSFLKNICSKEVGIYGIQGSFSRQLQETAGWVKTLPTEEEQHGFEYRLIFDTLKTSGTMLTEGTLINSITQNNKNVKKQNIQSALEKMKADGYISECSIGKKNSATKPSLFVDWDKVNNNLFVSEV